MVPNSFCKHSRLQIEPVEKLANLSGKSITKPAKIRKTDSLATQRKIKKLITKPIYPLVAPSRTPPLKETR